MQPYKDNWRDRCQTHPELCISAFSELAKKDSWPVKRWAEALNTWHKNISLEQKLWRKVISLLIKMPNNELQHVAQYVAWWLDATNESVTKDEKHLLNLCQRILNLPLESNFRAEQKGEPVQFPIAKALNHPIGMITKLLINLWLRSISHDNKILPTEIELLFTQICDSKEERFRYGRVLLASKLTALFRSNQSWTEQHLIPRFRWADNSVEAQIAWEGFLYSQSIHQPLLNAIEEEFIETARRYNDLTEYQQEYARFLTYATLACMKEKRTINFKLAYKELPANGLQLVARTLSEELESAGSQKEDYWAESILPFWKKMWPKFNDKCTNGLVAESLLLMSIAAGDKFPEAVELIRYWLRRIECPYYVIKRLQESELCVKFPKQVLFVLHSIIKDTAWKSHELGECLTLISQTTPELKNDPKFQSLLSYAL